MDLILSKNKFCYMDTLSILPSEQIERLKSVEFLFISTTIGEDIGALQHLLVDYLSYVLWRPTMFVG